MKSIFFIDREPLASNARIKLEEYDPAKLLWDASDYCSPTDPPETEKFHILVKKGLFVDVIHIIQFSHENTFLHYHCNTLFFRERDPGKTVVPLSSSGQIHVQARDR